VLTEQIQVLTTSTDGTDTRFFMVMDGDDPVAGNISAEEEEDVVAESEGENKALNRSLRFIDRRPRPREVVIGENGDA